MESLRQDVRLAIRLLLKQPGFSLLAIATLALGIGLSTALFSVLDAAFIRPLPYPNPEQLVDIRIAETLKTRTGGRVMQLAPSWQEIEDFRAQGGVFSHVAISRYAFTEPLVLDGPEPQRLFAQRASAEYFDMYGVTPFLGRSFNADETVAGGPNVVMLGHALWQSRFGGSRDILDTSIRLNDAPATVVGVLPSWFFPKIAVWRPLEVNPSMRRGSGAAVEGRLRPGVSIEQAEAALSAVLDRAAEARGGAAGDVELISMYESETASNIRTARIISYAVGLVLLLACVNVAGLLLARGAARMPELAVRSSLGARRGRLVRQLLTESVVLATAGGLLGLVIAWISLDVLVANTPMSLPPNAPVAINLQALGFAAAASIVTGFAFGLVPALRISRVSLGNVLSRAGRRHGSALSRRGGQALIAVEVALAVVLLAGAGLMLRSFARLGAVDVGYDPGAVIAMESSPAVSGSAASAQYYPALLERLRAHPAVAIAGATDYPPFRGGSTVTMARAEGRRGAINIREYLGDYFAAIGFTLVEGQFPTDADRGRAVPLAVLNESAAKALFPDGSAVRRQFDVGKARYEVAAIAKDARHGGPLARPRAEVFVPFRSAAAGRERGLFMIARPHPGGDLPPAVLREAAQAVGQRAIVGEIRWGDNWLGDQIVTPRRRTVLLGLLGGLGFLLALVGVFGMTAYAVARRTQEIGVRMAFGATPREVVRAMVRDSVWPVAIGVAAGLVGSWWATRVIQSFLFETEPRDIATFAWVAVLLAGAACVAAWIPARRAARVDPIVALRAE